MFREYATIVPVVSELSAVHATLPSKSDPHHKPR